MSMAGMREGGRFGVDWVRQAGGQGVGSELHEYGREPGAGSELIAYGRQEAGCRLDVD